MSDDQIIDDLKSTYGVEFTAADVRGYCASKGVSYPTVTKRLEPYKMARGKWNLEITPQAVENLEKSYQSPPASEVQVMESIHQNLIPHKDSTFVPFGHFKDIKKIIQSGIFYPTFITGLSGNGKTFEVEQACAQLGRELIRVNITVETDEDSLIGGFRLQANSNGATETVWHNGPVVEAMQRGAILLLDELDLASPNKILVLQSVLEGKGLFLKKIGQFISPKSGFNVIATANTKGKGSDDGRFIGTNVLNEAFIERFGLTFEQSYPSPSVEQKILSKVAYSLGLNDIDDFLKKLCDWSDVIRKTFFDGGIDEIISTRRLVHIVRAYAIFSDKAKAIQVCTNRFDDETKQAFMELYDKIDMDFVMPSENASDNTSEAVDETPPF